MPEAFPRITRILANKLAGIRVIRGKYINAQAVESWESQNGQHADAGNKDSNQQNKIKIAKGGGSLSHIVAIIYAVCNLDYSI